MESAATGRRLWTILSLLEWSAAALREKGFEDGRLNAELLLCRVLACERIDLYLKFDKILTEPELAAYKTLFKRRLSREPIQYILGETEFMGRRLAVDPRVFIPRPETELLVEEAAKEVKSRPAEHRKVVDIGTGSGNIAIGIASCVEGCRIDAVDVSADALEVARANVLAHRMEGRISLVHADIMDGGIGSLHPPYDFVLSNPPYISAREYSELPGEIRAHEPQSATGGTGDGLGFYRMIAGKGKELLDPEGAVYVEIGYEQSADVLEIFRREGFRKLSTVRDYDGNVRIVRACFG